MRTAGDAGLGGRTALLVCAPPLTSASSASSRSLCALTSEVRARISSANVADISAETSAEGFAACDVCCSVCRPQARIATSAADRAVMMGRRRAEQRARARGFRPPDADEVGRDHPLSQRTDLYSNGRHVPTVQYSTCTANLSCHIVVTVQELHMRDKLASAHVCVHETHRRSARQEARPNREPVPPRHSHLAGT